MHRLSTASILLVTNAAVVAHVGPAGAQSTAPSLAEPTAADESTGPPEGNALALHAEGLEAELDGDEARALALLRRAHAAEPTDVLVAFDLARLAYDQRLEGWERDAMGLLSLDDVGAAGPDASLLRAYLFIEQGERAAAAREVANVLAVEPSHAEALELRGLIGPTPGAEGEVSVSGRVRAGIEVDSNVAVAPDFVASGQLGTRAAVDGAILVTWRPVRTRVEAGGFFALGGHLNDRDNLAFYDSFSFTLFGRATYLGEGFDLGLTLIGSEVLIDGFSSHFMQDVGARATLELPLGPVSVGAYADGGHRDFIAGNPEGVPGRPEGDEADRDGPRGRAGVSFGAAFGDFALNARVGGQIEQADRYKYQEAGLDSTIALTWKWESLAVAGGVKYDYRNYHRHDRVDHRLTPYLKAGYSLTENLGVALSGVLMRNVSTDAYYDYTRVIVHLGGEATF